MSAPESRYRDLMTGELLVWSLLALASRAPVAMAPLALVFLSRESPGGYTLGAGLASGYVLGEVLGAMVFGARLARGRMRRQLAIGLIVGALALAALPLAGAAAPAPLLMGLAFLAGAAPAACPGGIRAVLTRLVPERAVARALSGETVLTQLTWAAAPALVVSLALRVHPGAPLLLGAALMAVATVPLLRLPEPAEPPEEPGPSGLAGPGEPGAAGRVRASTARTLLRAWPVYLTSAASMAMLATAELVLPALLEDRNVGVGWSGPLLAGFALASAAGAFCYGLRTWPGTVRTQSLVFLVLTAGCLALVVPAPGVPGVATALLLTGVFQAGVMVTRNLSLRERLPARAHAAAYSVMYAVGGVGYGLAASLSALVLELAGPTVAVLGGAAATLLITAVSALAETRSPGPGRGPGGPPAAQSARAPAPSTEPAPGSAASSGSSSKVK